MIAEYMGLLLGWSKIQAHEAARAFQVDEAIGDGRVAASIAAGDLHSSGDAAFLGIGAD